MAFLSDVHLRPRSEVRVSDHGPGLAPDQPEQIFESFYSTKVSGLGIGLSIRRKMIEAHGGRLGRGDNGQRH
jgi:signal transduction histidine kinase